MISMEFFFWHSLDGWHNSDNKKHPAHWMDESLSWILFAEEYTDFYRLEPLLKSIQGSRYDLLFVSRDICMRCEWMFFIYFFLFYHSATCCNTSFQILQRQKCNALCCLYFP